MLKYAILEHDGPIALRYPRGYEQYGPEQEPFRFGRSAVLRKGKDVTLVAVGNLVKNACAAADLLAKQGVGAEVLSLRTVKPLDQAAILASAQKTGRVITLEDHALLGGVGEQIAALLQAHGVQAAWEGRGYGDGFVQQAKVDRIHEIYGLDARSIADAVLDSRRNIRIAIAKPVR